MTMDNSLKTIIWQQLGAALDTLENAIRNAPESLWSDRTKKPEYWYTAFHALFWFDLYVSESRENFAPPLPFGLEEEDPRGILPPRVYTKDELITYAEYCREKGRKAIQALTDEDITKVYTHGSTVVTRVELMFYVMRHTQHHAAQLNTLLRQAQDQSSRWVFKAKVALSE